MKSDAPFIQTDRLNLRLASPIYSDKLLDYYRRNRDHLTPWEPKKGDDFYSIDHIHSRLGAIANANSAGSALNILIFLRQDDVLIGECNFTNVVHGPFQACYLGFSIDKEHEGLGLMTEGLRVAIAYVFDVLKLHRIMANYIDSNLRSTNLLGRLGFNVEGTAKSYLKINGAWRDHTLTSKLNDADL